MSHMSVSKTASPQLTSTPSNPSNTIEDWVLLKTVKGRPYKYSRHWGVIVWLDDQPPPELEVVNDWLHLKSFAGGPDYYFSKSTGQISMEAPETREEYRLMRQVSYAMFQKSLPKPWYQRTICYEMCCSCEDAEEKKMNEGI